MSSSNKVMGLAAGLALVAALAIGSGERAVAQNAPAGAPRDGMIAKPTKQLYNPPYPNNPVKPFKIIGNVYYVGLTNYTSFLISTPAGLILLDTEDEQFVQNIKDNIAALGFKWSDIKILLQAHAHLDHVGGLATLKKDTGATVYVMAEDAAVLADGGASDFRNFDGKPLWKPVKADKLLKDGDKVTLGGVTMTALLTPGHTKGCTTWTMTTEEAGKKYEVAFACSQRLNDGVPLVNYPKYPNAIADYAKGFAKLKTLKPDIFLASHAFMFSLNEKIAKMKPGAANPFVDREGYQAYIKDFELEYRYNLQEERAGRKSVTTTRR